MPPRRRPTCRADRAEQDRGLTSGFTSHKLRCTTAIACRLRESRHTSSSVDDGDEHGYDGRTVLGGGDLGPEPGADGLPDHPVATSASGLEKLHNNPANEAEPSKRREADCDQIVHFHPGLAHEPLACRCCPYLKTKPAAAWRLR